MKKLISFLLIFSFFVFACKQNSSKSPEKEFYMPVNIQQAYENGTRSYDGKPGKNYWQNSADYDIDIHFDPKTRLIKGTEIISYKNNSPNTLHSLYFNLFPNLYKKGNIRDFKVSETDKSKGIQINEIIIGGKTISLIPSDGLIAETETGMIVMLENSVMPNSELKLSISWSYRLNEGSHMRTGVVDPTTFFVAYFFPRVGVYDDINGGNIFMYTGDTEFYNDFGNYTVNINVPKNYIVQATGLLQNPEDVLQEPFLQKYNLAFSSDEIIHIVSPEECTQSIVTTQNTVNTWKYHAENVNDFAFALSDHYVWDASSIIVDKKNDRRVMIDAMYHKGSKDFYEVVDFGRQTIEFTSNDMPGVPFPFPKITVFNGLDAMEYPMMVNNISERYRNGTIKVTAHEIMHSYMPFYVGANETKYAWMDEGFTSFCDYLFLCQVIPPEKAGYYFLDAYKYQAGDFTDAPIFTTSEYLKRPVYTYNSYPKPAGFLIALKDLLGEDMFRKAIREFMTRWERKHPTPYDFFFTFNDVTGQNLNWFFKSWIFDFGYVDLSIKHLEKKFRSFTVSIEKIGPYPAPIHIQIEYENGSQDLFKEKPDVWKNGQSIFKKTYKTKKNVESVKLLDPTLLDRDLKNNVYK